MRGRFVRNELAEDMSGGGAEADRTAPAGTPAPRAADLFSPRELVARDIVRGLYDGRYQPGQRLTEAQLTKTYGVSRGPVREALNRLAAGGVVILIPERGAQVRKLSIEESIDTLIVLQGLIGMTARLAAMRIDDRGGATIRAALDDVDPDSDAADGDIDHGAMRRRFYAALLEVAGNIELDRILPTVHVHLIRAQFGDVMRRTDRTRKKDYRQIAEAVIAGRPVAAETAARRHIARGIEALEALLQAEDDA